MIHKAELNEKNKPRLSVLNQIQNVRVLALKSKNKKESTVRPHKAHISNWSVGKNDQTKNDYRDLISKYFPERLLEKLAQPTVDCKSQEKSSSGKIYQRKTSKYTKKRRIRSTKIEEQI